MPSHTTRPPCAPCREAPPENLTVEQAMAELRADGFTPGAPAHVTPFARHVDAATCRKTTCGRCGTRRLGYPPFHRLNQYRALAVCPLCHHAEEV